MRKLLVDVERRFQQAGIDSARTDAELLLAHSLGVSRKQLLLADDLTDDQLHEYELLVRRRVLREPLHYITGLAPFRKLELKVGPGVLVPRPETELIVDIAKRFAKPGIAVDLGSGSGCIALSLATEISNLQVIAVEKFTAAIGYLEQNVNRVSGDLAQGSSIEVMSCEIAELVSIRPDLIGSVQMVVSNPPYVPTGSQVATEVQHFEPAEAVFAAQNGYEVIDQVIAAAAALLANGGMVIIEHHESHGASGISGGVSGRLKQHGKFIEVSVVDDLTQRPRFTYAIKSAAK
jgi:release factor glutamine methyltransferase